MKKTAVAWISALTLVGALIVPIKAQPSPAPAAPAVPQRREPHPEIRGAIRALENAKRHLQEGAHDLSGHRAKALQLTDQAIEECRLAIRSDPN
jgi:hypothetical protein